MDFDEPVARIGTLQDRFSICTRQIKSLPVLAIPSHMSTASGFRLISSGKLDDYTWTGYFVVFANSHPQGHSSFISGPSRNILKETAGPCVRLETFDLSIEIINSPQ